MLGYYNISTMESVKTMFCSSPPFSQRTQHGNSILSSSPSFTSVLIIREQAAPAGVSWSCGCSVQNSLTSVLLQEQPDEYRPALHMYKEDKISQEILYTRQMEMVSVYEESTTDSADQLVHDFRRQLHLWPGLQNLLTSPQEGVIAASSTLQNVNAESERPADSVQCDTISLAKKVLLSSKQAASVAEDLKSIKADDDSLPFGKKTVRSTRLLERRYKQRKTSKSKVKDEESCIARKKDVLVQEEKKTHEGFEQDDPLRLFLWGPETKKLLTFEEETQLVAHIQDLMRLEEVKTRLQSQFGREPTIAEWADGVGLSCQVLQAKLDFGNRSREKLIQANLRLVVHIAKSYQGRGLSLMDLVQEGSTGLMKSVEKFKPKAGGRFGSYSFLWIRQAIRKAIFRHSKTIRLPETVYSLLGKVMEAKKLYIQEGNLHPTKEELARRVGITEDKIGELLFVARYPNSLQQAVQADQETTFQEITEDESIEAPDMNVEKQLMRRHVLNVLRTLRPNERKIIQLRFGMVDGEPKSLSEVAEIFGLSKERVRQLETRALYKLKKCLARQGLDAYTDLLV
ncbi:PREDICTED: RNA polymerase sigma factor sigF, chloroplastic isoform X2 [Lupinus angustifolius]|uniref:RNA polymerase sigma factor sigF, chloroplastic isoform X2 n=1 Tax=Lupinus angustifolius TaxID=3871 RepID=UPI00092FABB1|nr:PREDICTED: RNA polymerase sigma factor sigF, chloroplastic isoform X2 [Lupinus angustifolius]